MLLALAALLKAIIYAAALTGSGIALARATLGNEVLAVAGRAASLSRWAGTTLALVGLLSAGVYGLRLGIAWDPPTLRWVFFSPLGATLALQVVGGVWLAAGSQALMVPVAALLVLLSFAVSGHAPSGSVLAATAIFLHVSAAAWWIGGICILREASRSLQPASFSQLLRRFSSQALHVVAVLLIGGSLVAAYLLELDPDLSRPYHRVLLVKLGLAFLLLALAAFNKFVLMPALTRQPSALISLRRSMASELILFAAIAITTAALTTKLSPHD